MLPDDHHYEDIQYQQLTDQHHHHENINFLVNPTTIQDHHYHSTTGLVHCVMTRTTTITSSNRFLRPVSSPIKYQLAYQSPTNSPASNSSHQYILSAEKESTHQYTIRAWTTVGGDTTGTIIGSLVRFQMNMHCVSYALKNVDGMTIAIMVYNVPSPIQVLRNPPARRVELAILPLEPTTMVPSLQDEETEQFHSNDGSDRMTAFEMSCKKSIAQHHNLTGVVVGNSTTTALVFESKEPYASACGRVTLNFQGRGRFPSPKNMQLIPMPQPRSTTHGTTRTNTKTTTTAKTTTKSTSSNSCTTTTTKQGATTHGKIYMQMCKWEENTYNIDFSVPLTFLHAFAFGLAQVDL
jgi:Tub family